MTTRKKSKPLVRGFIYYDVLYDDGSRSSRRRVPAEILESLDGEKAVRAVIEEQDNEIAEKSGRPRGKIRQLVRSPA
ncbi:MAG: hypothetical protein BGP06_08820 [Rhizobiales bacterium 65-9]|nr:hypothetical protein [Hyphomicrobiales bacterium]OJY38705.1 MAG: hypothetical protein BGP06_08820 [Rhizobiales bacterium 65-9]